MVLSSELKKYFLLKKLHPAEFKQNLNYEIIFDEEVLHKFQKDKNRKIGVVYQSEYHYLVVDLIKKDGVLFCYERLIPMNSGGVVIVPIFDKKFILLHQFRHAMRDMQYSFPRGFGEPDLSASDNAVKELEEEICAKVVDLKKLGDIIADSGVSGNKVEVFQATVDSYSLNRGYEGIEDILLLPESDLKQRINNGEITDGFTLSAFSLYLVNDNIIHNKTPFL